MRLGPRASGTAGQRGRRFSGAGSRGRAGSGAVVRAAGRVAIRRHHGRARDAGRGLAAAGLPAGARGPVHGPADGLHVRPAGRRAVLLRASASFPPPGPPSARTPARTPARRNTAKPTGHRRAGPQQRPEHRPAARSPGPAQQPARSHGRRSTGLGPARSAGPVVGAGGHGRGGGGVRGLADRRADRADHLPARSRHLPSGRVLDRAPRLAAHTRTRWPRSAARTRACLSPASTTTRAAPGSCRSS